MSERYGFYTSWREIPSDRVERDLARSNWWMSYDQAREQHRRACAGGWVTDVMVDAQVGPLIGVDGGKQRMIAKGADLWVDDRPPLSRAEFAKLWREWKSAPTVLAAV